MKKEVSTYVELPLEAGKTYKTKFATGERFTVTRIERKTAYGIYENHKHLGECPLSVDRIIHEREYGQKICVCGNCGVPLEKEHENSQF